MIIAHIDSSFLLHHYKFLRYFSNCTHRVDWPPFLITVGIDWLLYAIKIVLIKKNEKLSGLNVIVCEASIHLMWAKCSGTNSLSRNSSYAGFHSYNSSFSFKVLLAEFSDGADNSIIRWEWTWLGNKPRRHLMMY